MKLEKGDYGYLTQFKKQRIGITLILVLAMAIIIGFGYWRYHTMKTIFTVVGILFALPIAKILSGLLVVLPIRPMEQERFEKMKKAMGEALQGQILWDLSLASTEKVRYFPCVAYSEKEVLVLYENGTKKTEEDEAKKYFRNLLKRNSHRAEFLFFTEEEKFLARAAKMDLNGGNAEERERIKETILVYEM